MRRSKEKEVNGEIERRAREVERATRKERKREGEREEGGKEERKRETEGEERGGIERGEGNNFDKYKIRRVKGKVDKFLSHLFVEIRRF